MRHISGHGHGLERLSGLFLQTDIQNKDSPSLSRYSFPHPLLPPGLYLRYLPYCMSSVKMMCAMAVPIQYDKMMAMGDTYLLQQTSADLIKKVNGIPELVGLYSQLLADVDRWIDAIRHSVTYGSQQQRCTQKEEKHACNGVLCKENEEKVLCNNTKVVS
jgi:hypothetical protein